MNAVIVELERRLGTAIDAGERIEISIELARQLFRNQTVRALELCDAARELASVVGDRRHECLAASLRTTICLQGGRLEEARRNLAEAERIAATLDDPGCTLDVSHARAMALHRDGEYVEASRHARRAIELCTAHGHHHLLFRSLNLLANCYSDIGDLEGALRIYLDLLPAQEEAGDLLRQGVIHNNLSGIYARAGDREGAMRSLERARDLYHGAGDLHGEAAAWMNIGVQWEEQHAWDEALSCYERGLELVKSIDGSAMLPVLLCNIGTIYEYTGRYDRAKEFEDRAEELARADGMIAALACILRCKGRLQVVTGEYGAARATLNEALELVRAKEDFDTASEIYAVLAQLGEAMGDARMALEYHKLRQEAADRFFGQEIQRKIAEIRMQHEMRRTEHDMEMLRRRYDQLVAESERKNEDLETFALHLARKHDLLQKLRSMVEQRSKQYAMERKLASVLLGAIDSEIAADNEWERFDRQFRAQHPGFTTRLVERFPDITRMEIKICTLLRAQLSTKDIADLLFISRHTVNTHRQRLRRKFGLGERENLVVFLLAI